MNVILFFMLFGTLIAQPNLDSDIKQVPRVTNEDVIHICRGNDAFMAFKFDIKANNINKLLLRYTGKEIYKCIYNNCTMNTSYKDRIVSTDKTWITLKNVSKDDEGQYTMHLVKRYTIQVYNTTINLHILEPPTESCTCEKLLTSNFTSEPTASYCGRPTVSPDLKKKKSDVSGDGNRIMNTTMQGEEMHCCLGGDAMKCVADKEKFCTTVYFHQDHRRPSDDGKTQHIVPLTVTGILGGILVILFIIGMLFKIREKKKKEKYVVDPELTREKEPLINQPMDDPETVNKLPKEQNNLINPELTRENEPLINQPMDDPETVNKLPKEQNNPINPGPETKEEIPMNQLPTVIKQEKQKIIPLYPRPKTGESSPNHPITESESGIELQNLSDTSLMSEPETEENVSISDSEAQTNTQNLENTPTLPNLRTEGENTVNQHMNSDTIIDIHERR